MIDAYDVARAAPAGCRRGAAPNRAPLALAVLVAAGDRAPWRSRHVRLRLLRSSRSSYTGRHRTIICRRDLRDTRRFVPTTPASHALPRSDRTRLADSVSGASDGSPTRQRANPPLLRRSPRPAGSSTKPKACPPPPDLSGWPPGADGRLNILLVGSDSRSDDGVSAASLRTDSMLLLSVDIADCKAALFSFPRNMTDVPGGLRHALSRLAAHPHRDRPALTTATCSACGATPPPVRNSSRARTASAASASSSSTASVAGVR